MASAASWVIVSTNAHPLWSGAEQPHASEIPRAARSPEGTVPGMASTDTTGTPFDLTPEQEEIRRVCRDFAAREIRPISAAVDEADTEVPWDLWHKAAGLGLTSFMIPEELGGGGMTDVLTGCIVQEELCHGCSGIGNLVTSGGFFAEPVLALGSDEQKERWVRALTSENPP